MWALTDAYPQTTEEKIRLITSLSSRAKAWCEVQEAIRGHVDESLSPGNSARKLIEQRNDARKELAASARELESLRSRLASKNETWNHIIGSLNRLPLDHGQRPSTGSLVDVVETVVRLIDERATLATRADLATKLFTNCRELIAFWRVGSEAFKMAANNLDTMLVRTIGTDYEAFTIAARAAQTAEAKTGAARKVCDVTTPIGVAAQKIEKGTLVSIDLPSGHVKPMDSGSVSAMDPMTTPKTEAEMPHVFECGCSKFKVLAGMCDVFDEFGRDRSKLAT